MQKIEFSVVVVGQNKPGMRARAVHCVNSLARHFDEVILVDWRSEEPLALAILPDLTQGARDKLIPLYVSPDRGRQLLTLHGQGDNETALDICEVLSRNIGIRRAKGDYIASTNIDIVLESFDRELFTNESRTFYTISRRDVTIEEKWLETADTDSVLRVCRTLEDEETVHIHGKSGAFHGDTFSKIDCCGDFQIAHQSVWSRICGFEESMVNRMYTDTRVQMKAAQAGYEVAGLIPNITEKGVTPGIPFLYHMNHPGRNSPGGRVNDLRELENSYGTNNSSHWGDPATNYRLIKVQEPLGEKVLRARDELTLSEKTVSDIQAHIGKITYFALCSAIPIHEKVSVPRAVNIVELGSREAHSSAALTYALALMLQRGFKAQLYMIDRQHSERGHRIASIFPDNIQILTQDSRLPLPGVESIDCLFVDTLHTKAQVADELRNHGSKMKKGSVVIFHDVCLFGFHDEKTPPYVATLGSTPRGGILSAIFEYFTERDLRILHFSVESCGLLVIEILE